RIAEPLVSAALIADLKGEGSVVGVLHRQADIQYAVVGFDFTEILVSLLYACWELCLADSHAGVVGLELKAMAIQVIAFGTNEAQLDSFRVGVHQAQAESFAHREEIGTVVQPAQRGAGAAVEQARGGGKGEQQD